MQNVVKILSNFIVPREKNKNLWMAAPMSVPEAILF